MRQAVEGSAHVVTIDYDIATKALTVEYRGGRLYRYAGVEFDEWQGLMRAPSKGSYLRRRIQPAHAAEKIGG
jgi:KTSC domain